MIPVLISRITLTYDKIDFGLDGAWTFSVTGHGNGAGNGVGALLKATARRAILPKSVHLSSAEDFYDFSAKDQFEKAKASRRENSPIYILLLEAIEVEKIKNLVINSRIEKAQVDG